MATDLILDLLLLTSRLLVALVLLAAGAAKLQAGPHWFLRVILGYELLPYRMAVPLARGLPWMEVTCGTLLLIGWLTTWAALLGFGLMLAFAGAITTAILRQKPADCGCFGSARLYAEVNRPRWVFIYRNLALAALAGPSIALGGGALALDGVLGSGALPGAAGPLVTVWVVALLATGTAQAIGQRRFGRLQSAAANR